jgi:hypothetical protein
LQAQGAHEFGDGGGGVHGLILADKRFRPVDRLC